MARPLKALILEDRPADAELILHHLAAGGYDVDSRRIDDGDSFSESLREPWDVILADYSMPQFDATQAMDILQRRKIDIPFIIITGSISEEVAVECMKRGAADYLIKDRLTRLASAVDQALEASRYRRERQQAEIELQLTQQMVDQSPLAIFRITFDGRAAYVNDAACRSLGYSAEELHELSVPDFDPNIPRDHWKDVSLKFQGLKSAVFETTHRRKDGSTFPVEITVQRVDFPGHECFVSFVTDLAERKRAQELVVESAKLRTVAGLAAGIAHEINNPLASMVQNAQAILNRITSDLPANHQAAAAHGTTFDAVRGFLEDREILHMLECIRVSGRQASGIVQNLLAYTRASSEQSVVNLNELVEQTLELAAGDSDLKARGSVVEFVRELAKDAPLAVCHRNQIMQALMNLLRNAAHAVQDNPPERPPRVRLRTYATRGFGCIDVIDNGPGISPELRDRLFEPFVTTKPIGQGTGLGLFISHYLVTVGNGGQLSAESSPGGGARFHIALRATEAV